MNEKNYAYVELTFYKNTKNYFRKIVSEVVSPDQFYYSDIISRIRGDVTEKAHFTLFFGLEEASVNNPQLQKLINTTTIKIVRLGKLELFEGYQGLYKVLCIKILDEDKSLFNLSNKMLNFDHDKSVVHTDFKPHITLAYVKSDYTLPKNYKMGKKAVRIKKIQISI